MRAVPRIGFWSHVGETEVNIEPHAMLLKLFILDYTLPKGPKPPQVRTQ